MSILHTAARHSGWLLLALAVLAPDAAAQQTVFRPALFVGAGFDSNLAYVGTEDELDDATATAGLELPVERRWRTGQLDLRYRGSYKVHQDADALDFAEHLLGFNVNSQPGRRSRISFGTSFVSTQDQARPGDPDPDAPEEDPFLSNRTDRRSLDARFDFEHELGPRWSVGFGAGWSAQDHEEIDDFTAADPDFVVEDRTEVRASASVERVLSRTTRAGLRYQRRHYDLDVSGEEELDLVSFTWEREVSRRLTVGFAVGGFRGTGPAADPEDEERSGVQGEVSVTRSYSRSSLAARARHEPSSGGHLEGAATYSELQMIYTRRPGARWSWQIGPRLARRDSTLDDREDRLLAAVDASAERFFGDSLGLRLGAGLAAQGDDGGSLSDRVFTSLDAGIVWYPRGRQTAAAEPEEVVR